MKILAFESSCDETAVAIVEDGRTVLTDQIFSQADLHAIYGGVVPEIAARSHVEVISILTQRALEDARLTREDIDAVAVTYAPGLIGAVLVGVNFANVSPDCILNTEGSSNTRFTPISRANATHFLQFCSTSFICDTSTLTLAQV